MDDSKSRTLTKISIRFSVLIHMYQVVAIFLSILRIDACPFQRFCIKKTGMSVGTVHDQRFIRADLIQIGFCDVFFTWEPACSHVDFTLRVLSNEFADDLTIFCVVAYANRCKVRLSDCAVTGKTAVSMAFQETGIDEVLTVIKHLCVCIGKLLCNFGVSDIGKHAVFGKSCFGKWSFFIHGNNVA